MTGGAGHTQDMQNRMRQNRSMRASQKNKYNSNKRDSISSKNTSNKQHFTEVSPEELEEIKSDIRKAAKQEKRKRIIISLSIIFALILTAFLIYYKLLP